MVPRSCGLLITAVVAGGSGVWHRTSNATLTDSYRRCPFMMPQYMDARYRVKAKRDTHCRDDAFPTYRGKIGRAPDRSSLEPLEPLAGRTIVFMGDSLTRQHFIATACRLRLDHALLHFAADFMDKERKKGAYLRSASATFRASSATFTLRLDADEHDVGLEAYVAARCADLRRGDVVVINEGAHYRHTPDTYGKRVRSALRVTANCTPLVIWRETAANHFKDGKWHGQHHCHDRTAQQDRRVSGPGSETYPVLNALANAAAEENGIPILRVYKDSLAAGALAHIGGSDCLHWCLPGVPDLWATELLSKIRGLEPATRQGRNRK
jgi:hypothetical protein